MWRRRIRLLVPPGRDFLEATMPDLMDHVQERVLRDLDISISEATTRREGLPFCEECDEPISRLRQDLGARLCVPHQQALEAEQARGGRR